MKKYLLSLLVVGLSFIGFSNSQCIESVGITSCPDGKCVGTNLNGISCEGGSDFQIQYYCKDGSNSPNSWVSSFVSASTIGSPCGGVGNLDYFRFTRYYGGNRNCQVLYNSNKMCVETLTPAIDGLHSTVNQIIPYVIFIGIGVLLAILGFYGIRRLVNRIAGKINSIFRSKRN